MHRKTTTWIHKTLHILEVTIAIITLVVLVGMLALEIYRMFTVSDYFSTVDNYLQNILTLVVGLEFVRMLLVMTPANTLEVLIVSIARHVILTHDPLGNVAFVVCIIGLFSIRRFLIPKGEMAIEFSEVEQPLYEETEESEEPVHQ